MNSLKHHSLRAINLLRPLWTRLNDFVLNIRTMPPGPAASIAPDSLQPANADSAALPAKHQDNFGYDSPEYWYLHAIVRRLKPAREDVFYDIGCGMGRVLCLVARRQIRKCVGIELFEPLCQMARQNALRLRGRKTPILVNCEDAATADLSDGTIYYLYNPFGKETLQDFLANLKTSVSRAPRSVTLVYYNSVYESIMSESGWLTKVDEFTTFSGQQVTFWKGQSGLLGS